MNIRMILPGLLALLFSCSGESPSAEAVAIVETVEPTIPAEDTFNYDTLAGMYVGDFGGSDIRLILNYVSQKKAIGYDIHKGLQRNLNGKVTRSGDSIQLVLNEPGDNKFDGIFTLNFIGNDPTPTGVWESNSGAIPKQEFKLSKMVAPKPGDDEEINYANFANYFGYMSDSIGDYQFTEDGLCVLEYYPKRDHEDRVEQLVELRGTWSLDGKRVTIDWQPNTVFPSRTMELEICKDEWDTFNLCSDNHEFYNHYYGP